MVELLQNLSLSPPASACLEVAGLSVEAFPINIYFVFLCFSPGERPTSRCPLFKMSCRERMKRERIRPCVRKNHVPQLGSTPLQVSAGKTPHELHRHRNDTLCKVAIIYPCVENCDIQILCICVFSSATQCKHRHRTVCF